MNNDPDSCATTVKLAYEVGLAGISIEDSALPSPTAYERTFAIERIRAASAAARALPGWHASPWVRHWRALLIA